MCICVHLVFFVKYLNTRLRECMVITEENAMIYSHVFK